MSPSNAIVAVESPSLRQGKYTAYWRIIATSANANNSNVGRWLSGIAISVVRIGLLAAIYKVAYRAISHSPVSYENAMWSMAIYFIFIMNLGLRNLFKVVEDEVVSGTVEVGLVKPVDWRLTKVCELIGTSSIEFFLQLVALPVALLIFVGAPNVDHLSPLVVASFVVLTMLAIITATALFTMVGLSAFWLTEAWPLFRIVDKVALIFGGGFVPIALLPHGVQLFVRYSPFGVYAAPTQLFNPNIVPDLPATLLAAAGWSAVLLFLCEVMWRRAERRIEVNGG